MLVAFRGSPGQLWLHDGVPGNNATIFQAMHQGKGAIDVHPDVWLPNQQSFTQKYVDGEKTVTLRGENIAAEFQSLVDEYVVTHYARRA